MTDKTGSKKVNVAYFEEFPEEHVDRIRKICAEKGVGFVRLDNNKDMNKAKKCDVFFGEFDEDILEGSDSIKWLQSSFAGVDAFTSLEVFDSGRAVLTNAGGAYDTMISEYLLSGAIALLHNLFYYKDKMNEHCWTDHIEAGSFKGKKVTVLGCGKIGMSFANMAHSMGATVTAVTASARQMPAYIDKSISIEELDDILPETEILVMLLPYLESTHNIMDERRLRMLRKGALVLNAGRGKTLDENALKMLLDDGYLGGAMLDVLAEEPLANESQLWNTRNLTITPHIAGHSLDSVNIENIIDIFEENLDRYIRGDELINVIDVRRGY